MRNIVSNFFSNIHKDYCLKIESLDARAQFISDIWEREGGGGGNTCVLTKGAIFEKAGVNYSEVFGTLNEKMSLKLTGKNQVSNFFACGVSLVLHPDSPYIPTTHANLRYLEIDTLKWFGGGTDLTPYYIIEEDCISYHKSLKTVCDQTDLNFYPKFKQECDQYFYLPHRNEVRGVGGIFFDYLGKDTPEKLDFYWQFIQKLSPVILQGYFEIASKRKNMTWGDREKEFQLSRRSRYVEFNLLYDRGTLFGLETNGRVESIFMSMPPKVSWDYNQSVSPDSPEANSLEILSNPRNWIT